MTVPALLVLLIAIAFVPCAARQEAVLSVGEHRAPSGDCAARITVSPMGEFLQLFLLRASHLSITHIADDVTGISWLSASELVYTAGPVYGLPGLFLVNCVGRQPDPVTLVAAKTYNSAYPKGADFFELKTVVGRRITFYYEQDVDAIDFNLFRTAPNERSIVISADPIRASREYERRE